MPPSISELVQQIQRQIDDGEYQQASALADAALAENPSDLQLLLAKINALIEGRQFADALPLCIQAHTRASTKTRVWTLLCRALGGIGFIELSLQTNERAVRHVTPDLDLLRFRGDMLYEGKHWASAIAAYQTVFEQFGTQPESWQAWYNYSDCLACLGKARLSDDADREALRRLRKVLESGHVTSEKQLALLWLHEGNLYERLKQWDLSEQSLMRSTSADWSAGAIWRLYMNFRLQRQRLRTAVTFPLAVAYMFVRVRRERRDRTSITEQRASISPALLSQIEALIEQ